MSDRVLDDWLALTETAPLGDRRRPRITLAYAQSLDGGISAVRGRPTAISGSESSRITHRLRAHHDAILVGIGTVLADDPRLTVRLCDGEDPRPVVLDAGLRTPPDARLLADGRRPLVFCAVGSSAAAKRLEDRGVELQTVERDETGRLRLDAVLEELGRRGIRRLMVEGGGAVLSSFLAQGVWDRAVLTVAPLWLGGYTPNAGSGVRVRLADPQWLTAGEDVICLGRRAA